MDIGTLITTAILLCPLLLHCDCANADKPVLDQVSDTPSGIAGWALGDRNAQTVTAGMSGTLLIVDLQIYQSDSIASGDVIVEIYRVLPQGPPDTDSPPLASALILNEDIPTQSDVDINENVYTPAHFLSTSLYFEKGDQFAIIPKRTDLSGWGAPPWMIWSGAGNTSSYDGGSFYLNGVNGWELRNGAHGFRTFMTPLRLGDADQNGVVGLTDVAPFVEILQTGAYVAEVDLNCDGVVDLLDVEPFVELLSDG